VEAAVKVERRRRSSSGASFYLLQQHSLPYGLLRTQAVSACARGEAVGEAQALRFSFRRLRLLEAAAALDARWWILRFGLRGGDNDAQTTAAATLRRQWIGGWAFVVVKDDVGRQTSASGQTPHLPALAPRGLASGRDGVAPGGAYLVCFICHTV
jgi:hypothetical protein